MRILCVFIVLVAFQLPVSRAEESPTVTVGVLLSLSGGLEQWCSHMRHGVELAASEDASSEEKVKVVFEDDRSAEKRATLSAVRKLLDRDRVDALFSWTPSTAPILMPLVQKAHVPLVVAAHDPRIVQAGEYVFGAVVNYDLVARSIARFFKARGARRVGLVLAIDDWSMSFESPFRDEAKRLGLDVVYSGTLDPHDSEARTVVSHLKRTRVEAVLAPLYGSALVSFVRRYRELQVQSVLNVADGMFDSDIKVLGAAAEGVTASQIWFDSPELAAKVKKQFGSTTNPLQLGLVASGYDLTRHIVGAVSRLRQQKREVCGESLNRELKTFRSRGYLGEYMLGEPPSASGTTMVVVKDGRFEPVSFSSLQPSE